MNEPEIACNVSRGRWDPKSLWQATSNPAITRSVLPNAGRQQQAAKEGYISWWNQASTEFSVWSREMLDFESYHVFVNLHSDLTLPPDDYVVALWRYAPAMTEIQNLQRIALSKSGEDFLNEPAFFVSVRQLEKRGNIDAALDILYDKIDGMLKAGKFDDVDDVLRSVDPRSLSLDLLLGVLTATLPARSKLPFRKEFFKNVVEVLKERCQWEEGLLTGLDG